MKHEKQVRANRSAASTVKQTQTTAEKPNIGSVRVMWPADVLQLIDKAAGEIGLSRNQFITEAVRERVRAVEDDFPDMNHQVRSDAHAPASAHEARPGISNLALVLSHCRDQVKGFEKMDPSFASASMEVFALCIENHPGLRREYQAMRVLADGIVNIMGLSEIASGPADPDYGNLSAGQKWAGVYFGLLLHEGATLEGLMSNLEGLGAVIGGHKETADMGKMLKGMEASYFVLQSIGEKIDDGLAKEIHTERGARRPGEAVKAAARAEAIMRGAAAVMADVKKEAMTAMELG